MATPCATGLSVPQAAGPVPTSACHPRARLLKGPSQGTELGCERRRCACRPRAAPDNSAAGHAHGSFPRDEPSSQLPETSRGATTGPLSQQARQQRDCDSWREEPRHGRVTAHPREPHGARMLTPHHHEMLTSMSCHTAFSRSTRCVLRTCSLKHVCTPTPTRYNAHSEPGQSSDSRSRWRDLPLWHRGSRNSCRPFGMFLTTSQE